QRDELTMGQAEIARLWAVDERTVKRDMARLRELGWVVVKRPGARGRVSVLGLGLDRILLDTRPAWPNIGPDFLDRMGGRAAETAGAGEGTTVVPFRRTPAPTPDSETWAAACALLAAEDRAVFQAWIAPLADAGVEAGQLILLAPSRFHASYVLANLRERLLTALRRTDPALAGVTVRG
ncbi:MAG TPA: DnaA N-terminal domain-containing protein, partial [Paracoccus sp. (in: a-proteobacteria)]|nr:DnaA N-terminal domain-containing protein [Paracoccus sp. (in: a-proteobacteria)]